MALTEEELQSIVDRAKQGDEESLGRLFTLFADRIYRFFQFRVSGNETAEDLTQTVFLEMLRSLPRYTKMEEAKFSTWLFQIARFRLIDHYRRDRPTIALEDAPADHASLSVDPPDASDPALEAAMHKLPERYQTVLHLRFHEDCAYEDVAKIMKTTVLNVRVLQHRALRALRKLISP